MSPAEQAARYAKARKITEALRAAKLDDPALLDAEIFELAYTAAGFGSASALTYALVGEMLRERVGSPA